MISRRVGEEAFANVEAIFELLEEIQKIRKGLKSGKRLRNGRFQSQTPKKKK